MKTRKQIANSRCDEIEHGVVTDWHDMEHIWQSVYKEMEIAAEDVRYNHNEKV